MNKTLIITYIDMAFRLVVRTNKNVLNRILEFLSYSYSYKDESNLIDEDKDVFTISLYDIETYDLGKPDVKKTSPYRYVNSQHTEFHLCGSRYHIDGNDIYDCVTTIMCVKEGGIDLYISGDSFYFVVNVIRDVFLNMCEMSGKIILHASAAEINGKLVAITGDKGCGKTTYLYDMIVRESFSFFSGDKLVVHITNEGVKAYSWPDIPSITSKTLLAFPEQFHDHFNNNEHRKIIFDEKKLSKILHINDSNCDGKQIHTVLFADINGSEDKIAKITPSDIADKLLPNILFSIYNMNIDYTWNPIYILPDAYTIFRTIDQFTRRLSDFHYYQITGKSSLNRKKGYEYFNDRIY